MPQLLLPIIPAGATRLSDRISIVKQEEQWIYFNGVDPLFAHHQEDLASFRLFSSQLINNGACTQAQIIKTFGVAKNGVKRYVKLLREQGSQAFFRKSKTRGPTVLTDEVLVQAQELLTLGNARREVATLLGIKYDTLRKAINQGRLHEPPPQDDHADATRPSNQADQPLRSQCTPATPAPAENSNPAGISNPPTDKSQRSQADVDAEMGVACTRPIERVLASIGVLPGGATTEVQECRDVTMGGVLCALPGLTANGLFSHLTGVFPDLGGYYTTLQIVTLLANMAPVPNQNRGGVAVSFAW